MGIDLGLFRNDRAVDIALIIAFLLNQFQTTPNKLFAIGVVVLGVGIREMKTYVPQVQRAHREVNDVGEQRFAFDGEEVSWKEVEKDVYFPSGR